MLSHSREWTPEHDISESPRPKSKSEVKPFSENHKVKDNSSKYKQKKIEGDNVCTRFLYNLPPGILLFFIPGFIFLVIGVVMIVVTRQTESWTDGMTQTGVIFTAIGAVLLFCGLIACATARCKVKDPVSGLRWSSTDSEVKLVSVHRIPSVSASHVNFRLETSRQYENQAYVT